MNDLVYILGDGSRWGDNELRFSLRSAERYLEHGKVFLIGECPEWIQGVTHIPVRDANTNKIKNAIAKYRTAALEPRISEQFVLMNDDFFFKRPIEAIPAYSRGKLRRMIDQHPTGSGYYYQSLVDTMHRLSAMGIVDPLDFEVHGPIVFDKQKLITTLGMVGEAKAFAFRTCYGNLMNVPPAETIDFKAANLAEFAYQRDRDVDILSINDALVAAEEFREWIIRKFPEPSRYELDTAGVFTLPGRRVTVSDYHATQFFTFGQHQYNPGDIIDWEDVQALKNSPKMRDCWEQK